VAVKEYIAIADLLGVSRPGKARIRIYSNLIIRSIGYILKHLNRYFFIYTPFVELNL
jgi:hypothetical protein